MTRYLIDADGVIDYLKGFQPTVEFIQRLDRRGDIPCTCDVVMGEVYNGVHPHDEHVAGGNLRVVIERDGGYQAIGDLESDALACVGIPPPSRLPGGRR